MSHALDPPPPSPPGASSTEEPSAPAGAPSESAESREGDIDTDVALVRAVTGLAIVATILGRALGPAVPGSAAGIERLIWVSDNLTGLFTQAFVFAGTALAVWLLIATLRQRELPLAYRFTVVPVGAAVVTLIMMSAREALSYSPTVFMAVLTNLIVMASTFPVLRIRATRAVGLALTLASLSSLAYVASRVLALRASQDAIPSMFAAARWVATGGLGMDVVSLLIVGAWLMLRDWKRGLVIATILALAAATISWAAAHGSMDGAPLWQVIAARSLGEIVRNPAPFVVTELRYFVHVMGLLVAVAAFVAKPARSVIPCAAAFVVLARASADVPLGALSLTLATLLLAMVAGSLAKIQEEAARTAEEVSVTPAKI